MNLDVLIFFFPVMKQYAPYFAMGTACEEGKDGTIGRGLAQVRRPQHSIGDEDFRQRDVADRFEPFTGVGIAQNSDEVSEELRVGS